MQQSKTSQYVKGQNRITINFYFTEDRYYYSVQAIFGKRAYAIWPEKTSDLESLNDARNEAMHRLEKWCRNNNLIKQFNSCLGVFQPELDF